MRAHHKLRRKELAATISLLLAAHGSAYAQDQASDADDGATEDVLMEEVIVTGSYRASLLNSMSLKRDSTSLVEAISAEDLGKLPDVSIAESLARLPGIAVQRLNGRGQQVSIRGLSPDFNTGLLNGREQVSVGDNRGVEFDQYPSEMITEGVVYKTPNAVLMGQGLAGTVDMRTIRPLEYGKQALVVNARYIWNDIDALNSDAPDDGWRGSVTWVDQFADDTFGVAFGIAYNDTPTQSERFNAWGYLASWIANLGVSWLVVWVLPAFGVIPELKDYQQFWILMLLGALVYIPVTFLTKPEKMDHLVKYYVMSRPIGWWKPVRREAERLGLM